MQFINKLFDGFFSINPWLMLLICWAIMPGGTFAAGIIGESRFLPLGEIQDKKFFPGDLAFGLIMSQLAVIHRASAGAVEKCNWGRSLWWFLVAFSFAVGLFLLARLKFDAPNYPERAQISPTKLYHDIVGYFGVSFVLVFRGLPEMISGFNFQAKFNPVVMSLKPWLIIVFAIAFYAYCGACEEKRRVPVNAEMIEERHPSDWAPIWETHKIKEVK